MVALDIYILAMTHRAALFLGIDQKKKKKIKLTNNCIQLLSQPKLFFDLALCQVQQLGSDGSSPSKKHMIRIMNTNNIL